MNTTYYGGVFVKISSRAKSRELKRIDRFLIKFRKDVDGHYVSEHDKKSAFLDLRWKARKPHKAEDMRQRIFSEPLNRTTRNHKALQFEAAASGVTL